MGPLKAVQAFIISPVHSSYRGSASRKSNTSDTLIELLLSQSKQKEGTSIRDCSLWEYTELYCWKKSTLQCFKRNLVGAGGADRCPNHEVARQRSVELSHSPSASGRFCGIRVKRRSCCNFYIETCKSRAPWSFLLKGICLRLQDIPSNHTLYQWCHRPLNFGHISCWYLEPPRGLKVFHS